MLLLEQSPERLRYDGHHAGREWYNGHIVPPFLTPKLVTTLKSYDRGQLVNDLIAGLIVGVVAIPLALAFGIASGVTPADGLYSAVVGGFLISLLGGSRVQIGGPTGAFVVIIYGIVQQYGRESLAVCRRHCGATNSAQA